jgi:phage terminase small subunit
MAKKLSIKQQAFVEHYLNCWSETEAARRAGYANPESNAYRLMVIDGVKAAIAARLTELKMSADEVLTRLTEHARGSIAPFLVTNGNGIPVNFNLSPDRPLHLVKKVSITDKGISFEVYDAQSALALLGRHHKLFADRVEHTGAGGGPIQLTPVDYRAGLDMLKPDDDASD